MKRKHADHETGFIPEFGYIWFHGVYAASAEPRQKLWSWSSNLGPSAEGPAPQRWRTLRVLMWEVDKQGGGLEEKRLTTVSFRKSNWQPDFLLGSCGQVIRPEGLTCGCMCAEYLRALCTWPCSFFLFLLPSSQSSTCHWAPLITSLMRKLTSSSLMFPLGKTRCGFFHTCIQKRLYQEHPSCRHTCWRSVWTLLQRLEDKRNKSFFTVLIFLK